jgi:hypothetical protein
MPPHTQAPITEQNPNPLKKADNPTRTPFCKPFTAHEEIVLRIVQILLSGEGGWPIVRQGIATSFRITEIERTVIAFDRTISVLRQAVRHPMPPATGPGTLDMRNIAFLNLLAAIQQRENHLTLAYAAWLTRQEWRERLVREAQNLAQVLAASGVMIGLRIE